MKKQFDLQYYLAHPDVKVVMRDGRDAKIIDTDFKGEDEHAIVCKYKDKKEKDCLNIYRKDGTLVSHETDYDLFFDLPDPVKKRVPLTYEDLLERVKDGKTMWIIRSGCAVHIIGFCDSNIKCAINFESEKVRLYTYSDMMVWGEFADGDPCWKEVEK